MKGKRRDWTSIVRPAIQAGFGLFILVAAVRHHLGAVDAPSVHALCPFGAIESVVPYVTTGALVPKLHLSTVVLAGGLLLSAVLVGGAFCGWVCPFGALADLLSWVRARLHIREVRVPTKLDRVLRYGRYVALAGIVYATTTTAKLWFADVDPYYTLFSLDWLFELNLAERWPAYAVTGAIVIGSVFVPRLWCRYLCPLGALLSVIQRISPIKVRRNASACIDCKRCDRACPVKLQVSSGGAVSHDCAMCLKCTQACPVPGALEVSGPGYERHSLPSPKRAKEAA